MCSPNIHSKYTPKPERGRLFVCGGNNRSLSGRHVSIPAVHVGCLHKYPLFSCGRLFDSTGERRVCVHACTATLAKEPKIDNNRRGRKCPPRVSSSIGSTKKLHYSTRTEIQISSSVGDSFPPYPRFQTIPYTCLNPLVLSLNLRRR